MQTESLSHRSRYLKARFAPEAKGNKAKKIMSRPTLQCKNYHEMVLQHYHNFYNFSPGYVLLNAEKAKIIPLSFTKFNFRQLYTRL